MKYLRNKKAWANYSRNQTFANLENGGGPDMYPCVVYTTVAHWGFEQENVHFLYPDDVFKMAMRMRAEMRT